MNSLTRKTTAIPNNNLSLQLQHIGLRALPDRLDDFLAHASKARWSPRQLLEQLAQAEITERSRRSDHMHCTAPLLSRDKYGLYTTLLVKAAPALLRPAEVQTHGGL